jgi:hypothetical protein
MYWSPVRLPCMVTKSSLQSWEIHPKPLLSLHRKGQLAGATSCCPPFRQPPTSYKACVYGWQRQASSFKSSNRLPPKRNRNFCSLTSHEPGFESHRTYLGHVRPSHKALEPPVQNIRQLEAALHREWQQLSQQDIRRLTGGMRRITDQIISRTQWWPVRTLIGYKKPSTKSRKMLI